MKRLMLAIIISLPVLLAGSGLAANSEKNFGGIGIDGVPLANGEIVVRQLVVGAPAQRAGVRIGDIITSIDSKPTKGSNFREMVDKRLRSRAGTKVLIVIRRPHQDKPLRFNITRRQIIASGK